MGISFNDLCSNLLPAGRVKAQVTDLKFKVGPTGEASNDIVVVFTIVEGAAAKRTHTETLYEKAASFRLKPFLMACGVDMNRQYATKEELYQFGLKEAKGKIIMIDLGIKTYQGKQYNEITAFSPLPGSTHSAEDVLASFDSAVKVETTRPVEAPKESEVILPEFDTVPTGDMPTLDINTDDNPF